MNKVVTYTVGGEMNQTKMNPEELHMMEVLAEKHSDRIVIVKVETPRRRRSR